LDAWKGEVDSIIDHFRLYKSNVPTYGAILLDETLTYVLLVQGWFATKNNWGFPKGKVLVGIL
jgi:mRNA-decapping enzyme subunit 2